MSSVILPLLSASFSLWTLTLLPRMPPSTLVSPLKLHSWGLLVLNLLVVVTSMSLFKADTDRQRQRTVATGALPPVSPGINLLVTIWHHSNRLWGVTWETTKSLEAWLIRTEERQWHLRVRANKSKLILFYVFSGTEKKSYYFLIIRLFNLLPRQSTFRVSLNVPCYRKLYVPGFQQYWRILMSLS